MSRWLEDLRDRVAGGTACALVTVVETAGSAPREAGARLLVERHGLSGTIGGGTLEFQATARARDMLAEGSPKRLLQRVALGPALGQCCGGSVVLAFELVDESDRPWLETASHMLAARREGWLVAEFAQSGPGGRWVIQAEDGTPEHVAEAVRRAAPEAPVLLSGPDPVWVEPVRPALPALWLFGAGHVGRAIAGILEELPLDVTWFDSRADAFPDSVPANVTPRATLNPELEVAEAPAGALFLVLTHSHQLDQDICGAVFRRGDFRYLGLIGSRTKRSRFMARWRAEGLPDEILDRLVCPIGIPGLSGKSPREVAIATVAQVLQELDGATAA